MSFNGLTLSNDSGPAINIQSSKRISVFLEPGTTNALGDAAVYNLSAEDQKATFTPTVATKIPTVSF